MTEWITVLQPRFEMFALDARSPTGDLTEDRLPEPRIPDQAAYRAMLTALNGSLKLNPGSGPRPLPGYINVDYREGTDVDLVADVRRFPLRAGDDRRDLLSPPDRAFPGERPGEGGTRHNGVNS